MRLCISSRAIVFYFNQCGMWILGKEVFVWEVEWENGCVILLLLSFSHWISFSQCGLWITRQGSFCWKVEWKNHLSSSCLSLHALVEILQCFFSQYLRSLIVYFSMFTLPYWASFLSPNKFWRVLFYLLEIG